MITAAAGNDSIVQLVPRVHTVTLTLPGFATVAREGIVLTTGFTTAVDAQSRIGAVGETIQVTGASKRPERSETRPGSGFRPNPSAESRPDRTGALGDRVERAAKRNLLGGATAGAGRGDQSRLKGAQALIEAVYATLRGRLDPPGRPLGWFHAFFEGENGNTYVPRLEVKVVDKTNGSTVRRDVTFQSVDRRWRVETRESQVAREDSEVKMIVAPVRFLALLVALMPVVLSTPVSRVLAAGQPPPDDAFPLAPPARFVTSVPPTASAIAATPAKTPRRASSDRSSLARLLFLEHPQHAIGDQKFGDDVGRRSKDGNCFQGCREDESMEGRRAEAGISDPG